jgi:two-component system cell cycle response regulator DivK
MKEDAASVTVLVVEDFPDTRMMLRQALEMHGFRAVEAANGWEAVAVAMREHPRLILMDLHLPVLDGFETTCLLREHPETRDVPIIAVSAYDSIDDHADAKDAGITAYVTKPVDVGELLDLISRLLAES